MVRHRVGRLSLRVSAPRRGEQLASEAEGFVRAVLERAGDLLELRHPGRYYLLERLPLRLAVSERSLGDVAEVERLAQALADDVEASAALVRGLVPPVIGPCCFETLEHLQAARLHAAAIAATPAACFLGLESVSAMSEGLVHAESAEHTLRVLLQLAQHGGLAQVLANGSESWVRALARVVESLLARGAPKPGELGIGAVAALRVDSDSSLLSELSEPAFLLVLRIHAYVAHGAVPSDVALADALHARTRQRTGEAARIGSPFESPSPTLQIAETARFTCVHTEWAGLFYLLSLALEMRLGEILYTACVAESVAFAEGFRILVGTAGRNDPAVVLAAGGDAPAPEGATLVQHEEVAVAMLAELASAIPRRGLAEAPTAWLSVHGAGAERVLCGRVVGLPFAMFVWPADSLTNMRLGVQRFLEIWPRTWPAPCAAPALAELDADGRVRPVRQHGEQAPLGLVSGAVADGDAERVSAGVPRGFSALVAQLAGTLGTLFHLRLGSGELELERCAERFAIPAEIRVHSEGRDPVQRLVVTCQAADTRLDIRRAGLDRNPGFVPWLNQYVEFAYAGAQEF